MLENRGSIKVERIKVKSLCFRRKLMDKHCHIENKQENVKILRGAVWGGSLTYGFEAKPFQRWNGLGTDMMIGLGTNFWANSLFILPKNEILAESEFATPTIIKLIPLLFSTLGAFMAYNINFVANPLIFALKT